MASYLTLEDERNFGPELLDVATRAARHALAPELQQLRDENQALQDQLDSATKMSIDQYLDAHVPNWRSINADERFHNWLLQPEPYSGIIRDRLLKDAAQAANASRVASFFKGFLAAAGQAPAGPCTAASVPILPPPPGLLSITNCCPSRSDSHCPIRRAVMSDAPAGAVGTIRRTGRVG